MNEEPKNEFPFKTLDEFNKWLTDLQQRLSQLQQEKDKYLQKLVYNLSPITHELSTTYNEKFKEIIKDNIDKTSYEIRVLLQKCWEDKTFSQSEYLSKLKESDKK